MFKKPFALTLNIDCRTLAILSYPVWICMPGQFGKGIRQERYSWSWIPITTLQPNNSSFPQAGDHLRSHWASLKKGSGPTLRMFSESVLVAKKTIPPFLRSRCFQTQLCQGAQLAPHCSLVIPLPLPKMKNWWPSYGLQSSLKPCFQLLGKGWGKNGERKGNHPSISGYDIYSKFQETDI